VITEFCEGFWDARCDDCGAVLHDMPSRRDADDFLEAHMAVVHGPVELDLGGHPSCQACRMAEQMGRPGCPAHSPETVGMLDHADRTLHRPGNVHLMTACGVHLVAVTLGPMSTCARSAVRRCPECLPERSEP